MARNLKTICGDKVTGSMWRLFITPQSAGEHICILYTHREIWIILLLNIQLQKKNNNNNNEAAGFLFFHVRLFGAVYIVNLFPGNAERALMVLGIQGP